LTGARSTRSAARSPVPGPPGRSACRELSAAEPAQPRPCFLTVGRKPERRIVLRPDDLDRIGDVAHRSAVERILLGRPLGAAHDPQERAPAVIALHQLELRVADARLLPRSSEGASGSGRQAWLAPRARSRPARGGGRAEAQVRRLKQHVLSRLADPELSPGAVAGAQFVSVRQVHRLFALEKTTFGRFVREERMWRCGRELADPRLARVPIADIASRWGYRSPAHFSRHFGVGPHEFRRAVR
jgi:AraC-like DNA-binding protein